MARIRIGDIIEIPTPKGFAYAQFINEHKRYGPLLRVFCGLHDGRPTDPTQSMVGEVQFVCFFPLRAAIRQKIVSVVARDAVPPEAAEFPVFRAGVVDPTTGKVAVWWLWDGEREWRVGTLSDEQRSLPIRGVWNDTLLIERILAGWRPQTDSST